MQKIKQGDTVIVITGKDKGKKGDVLKVFPRDSKILVAGVNVVKRHTKPTEQNEGGVLDKVMPIDISNVAYYDEKTKGPSKIGFKFEDGKKFRFVKKSGMVLKK